MSLKDLQKKDEHLIQVANELRIKEKDLKFKEEVQNRKDIDLKIREDEQKQKEIREQKRKNKELKALKEEEDRKKQLEYIRIKEWEEI